ncbi:hypothetical protein BJ138DRAFT_1070829 [Hygrophoropsis aurantiaca]|uniref:Uncharacterized protein n=1 Tax=Hygrophoropsis aurantiaca TaxID=72124 RepID=A0ACB8A1T3_9AGAM|nr:hypothetical protein BJ138DRAFT_1070829 [Hygrophoropsis aurantiaca]
MSNHSRGTAPGATWAPSGYSVPQPQLQLEEEYPHRTIAHEHGQSGRQYGQQMPMRPSYSDPYSSVQYDAVSPNRFGSMYAPPLRGGQPSQSLHSSRYESSSRPPDTGRTLGSIQTGFNTAIQRQPQYSFLPSGFPTTNQSSVAYPSSFSEDKLSSNSASSMMNTSSSTTGSQTSPFLSASPMQFSYPQPLPTRISESQAHYMQHIRDNQSTENVQQPPKRVRRSDDEEQFEVAGEIGDASHGVDATGRPRPSGACARCKSLKVRCEFKGDPDTCKRCINAGQDCHIPGRKPRRTPPKREILLKQIREQAAQIQDLMKQLEEATNKRSDMSSARTPASTATLSETNPLSPSSSHLQSPADDFTVVSPDTTIPRPEVQDWIAKAQESINAFGGLIAQSPSANSTSNRRTEEDPDYSDEEYAITFEGDSDDEADIGYATADDENHSHRSASRERSSISSVNAPKKKELKVATMPAEASPFGLMAQLSIQKRQRSVEPEQEDVVGVARDDFFQPSNSPDTLGGSFASVGHQPPHILTREVVTPKEAEMLFKYYFDNMNLATSLLDPDLHTPQYVAMRSPFLFTVVCAISSRYQTGRPGLYAELMRYAQLAAGTALIGGSKNEEMCAAYILLSLYPVPVHKWEEDRTWIYLGLAIRFAQDLGLNRPNTTKPLNERHARVMLTRTRFWLNCFNLDRSTSSMYGKRPVIPNTDYISTHLDDWWKSSEYNLDAFDIHLCIYNAELRIMADFMAQIYSDPNHPIGLNKSADFLKIASETDDKITQIGEIWFPRLKAHTTHRNGLLKMALNYARLVALSSGLQHAPSKTELGENSFLMRCFRAASDVITAVLDEIYATSEQKKALRHAPDAQCVFVTFASAFLVKLLQPKYASYFPFEQRLQIRALVQRVVDLLGSPEVVVDERHAPRLYSLFLAGLLATPMAQVSAMSPTSTKSPLSLPRKQYSRNGKGNSSMASGIGASTSDYSQSPSPPQPFLQQQLPRKQSSLFDTDGHTSNMNSSYFYASVPIDSELLESMQFMSDPMWQETAVPGLQWMSEFHSGNTGIMNDYTMYQSPQSQQQYPSGPTNY